MAIVFVVDDEARRAPDLLREDLEFGGHVAVVVGTGREALQLMEEGLRYDIILADRDLSGAVHGDEVLQRSMELYPSVPRVTYSGAGIGARCATHHILKAGPDDEDLSATINKILRV